MLLQCDASQLEWRVALELSNEQVGINEIIKGEDTHANNQKAFDLPSRLIAKIFLFRTIFRGSGWAFANDADFTHVSADPKFWDALNEKFYKKYASLDKQHKIWMALVSAGKDITGPLGRSWHLDMTRDYKGELKLPLNQLVNLPVQGTGADIMTIARISAYKRIKKAGIPCDFISTVHDSIVVDTRSCYLSNIACIFDNVFADLPMNIKAMFGYEWKCPMACESKYGPNMKDMKKISTT
jgi:DNA polymerase-1